MSDTAIDIQNLSKRYLISHRRDASDGLRHAVEEALRNPFRWMEGLRKRRQAAREEFWALKDVSFSVKQGM
jgi:lipopolysaccharide transport system ATP-binding protein